MHAPNFVPRFAAHDALSLPHTIAACCLPRPLTYTCRSPRTRRLPHMAARIDEILASELPPSSVVPLLLTVGFFALMGWAGKEALQRDASRNAKLGKSWEKVGATHLLTRTRSLTHSLTHLHSYTYSVTHLAGYVPLQPPTHAYSPAHCRLAPRWARTSP